ncbi:MAG: hypothetical protein NTX61_15125 [Bacteroidetes bacterium]|nr:hypothetical protein [Bacteroidota bacterium]
MKHLYFILVLLIISISGFSQTTTNVGTDFWIAFPPNQGGAGVTLQIFISSNFSTSGNVTSAYPGVDQSFTVIPGIVTQLTVPSGVALGTGIEDKGIRITSNDPVSVYGLNHRSASTDAFLALPVNALGLDYRILTYKVTLSLIGSALSIVATQDGTSLIIFNHQTNSTTNVTLNQGQTYLEEVTATLQDVTGSRIQSNFPVGVFGSVKCVDIPTSSCSACDHIVEMMWPVNSWGKNFVTVPLAGRDNSGDIFRVLAGEDGTDVLVNGTLVSTLNTGDYYEANLVGNNSITTSKATLLGQYAKGMTCTGNTTGDPLIMLIPPCEQFLTNYTIVNVAGGFLTHWVNVVAPDYALGTIYQDGILIPNAAFTQISTTNFYGAQRSVTAGSHTFTSTFPFGVFVYGWGNADSYGYPGGGSLSPVGTVHNVTLSPDTAYGQLNVTNVCVTANVTDNYTNPVVGVLVNFYISGINPLVGNAYTDALGNAQYCYTQTGVVPGEDHIYAEVFGYKSDTSVVFWSYTPPCTNPVSGGTIGNDQSGCGSFTPTTLTNIQSPGGFTGTLEYKWQVSTTSGSTGFSDIAGSNAASYTPGMIIQTTWFKRLARVNCMTDWSGAVESNVVGITIVPQLPVNVSISPSAYSVCAGTSVTFSATPTNGGTTPVYQWKVNGLNAGSSNPQYTYSPVNSDVVTCVLTSSEPCTSGNPATSNPITLTVNPNLPVSITVSPSANSVCSGTSVTYSATPQNQGTTPVYQWKVNGGNTGANNTSYSYVPANGDAVTCVLTSNAACANGNPATSNAITMTVNPNLPVSIAISASANPVCAGTTVTFTATPTNGGISPTYQWKVDGNNVGTNSQFYSCIPAFSIQLSCILTSNATCPTGNPATSNTINMTVNPLMPVTISIGTSINPVCAGIPVTFTATPTNAGTTPVYQWKVNAINAGTNSSTYPYVPINGDTVNCTLTSSFVCATGNPATSNFISMTVKEVPVVSFTNCNDSITTINAQPFRLKGGIPLGGTYSGPGVTNGIFYPAIAGAGTKTITYSYINAALCSGFASRSLVISNSSLVVCGNPLTDIRDNKVYPTVQIGSQCWMAADLNYGTMIPGNISQRDNCINEKYCLNDITGNCQLGTVYYQWDEIMQYDDSPAKQGLCPPAWHVPTETEWTTLFNNFINNGFAGSPLKSTGYSGFNAIVNGTRHMNLTWDFTGMATFFWSSDVHSASKAWAHGMNSWDPSVSLYPSLKSNAFSVRCLKD